MGNFYTNITVKVPDSKAVLRELQKLGRKAYVSDGVDGCVVVFDEACEQQDEQELRSLGATLSGRFGAAALALLNHDDDVLMYFLFEAGAEIDSYNSSPNYFDGEPTAPSGGDAEKLSRGFDKAVASNKVDQILHDEGGEELRESNKELATLVAEQQAKFIQQFQGQPELLKQLEQTFAKKNGRGFAFEVERHEALVNALGLPECAVGNGYNYLNQGEKSGELDEEFQHT